MQRIQGISQYTAVANTTAVERTAQTTEAEFGNWLTDAVDSVDKAQHSADNLLTELASADSVDIHGTSIAFEKADIALRTMVSVRDRVISAYEQVMNMAV